MRRSLLLLVACSLGGPIASAHACAGVGAARAGTSWSAKIAVPATEAHALPAAGPVVARLATELAEPGRAPVRVRVLSTRSVGAACWLRVVLPMRPNGSTGWIAADRTMLFATRWRLALDRAARRLTVWHDGHEVRRFTADVGAPATPTPAGRFSILWARRMVSNRALGPWILPISATSDVLRRFAGGPGRIALHGWSSGGPFGRASSHGCARLADGSISWLVGTIGEARISGVPVDIT